jgi:hypothetical protein
MSSKEAPPHACRAMVLSLTRRHTQTIINGSRIILKANDNLSRLQNQAIIFKQAHP